MFLVEVAWRSGGVTTSWSSTPAGRPSGARLSTSAGTDGATDLCCGSHARMTVLSPRSHSVRARRTGVPTLFTCAAIPPCDAVLADRPLSPSLRQLGRCLHPIARSPGPNTVRCVTPVTIWGVVGGAGGVRGWPRRPHAVWRPGRGSPRSPSAPAPRFGHRMAAAGTVALGGLAMTSRDYRFGGSACAATALDTAGAGVGRMLGHGAGPSSEQGSESQTAGRLGVEFGGCLDRHVIVGVVAAQLRE